MNKWYFETAKKVDGEMKAQAETYQLSLTKPPGSLGKLEGLAALFSAYQNTLKPEINNIEIVVMAGDHGVAEEGVSAFPQAVTAEMVKNFASGGAAISVLTRYLSARLTVLNLGTVSELDAMDNVIDKRIDAGTANFCKQPAMTEAQLEEALSSGAEVARQAANNGARLFIGGEMGIANTTAAACIVARLLAKYPEQVAGPGTGLDAAQIQHKSAVIERALAQHPTVDPLQVLRSFGGFEIAGLTGAYIACSQLGIPVLIDGYIATAAALVAVKMNSSIQPWLIASHRSAEPAHIMMLEALGLEPLIDFGMRLGEGSGAAVAVPVLQAACKLQSEMASFEDAGVSEKL